MARTDLTLPVGADTRPAEKDIARLTKKTYRLKFAGGADKFSQPLGRITGQLGEFEKSLEASNARVLAFSASAGALYAVQKGLRAIVEASVDVEKRLADINVILNVYIVVPNQVPVGWTKLNDMVIMMYHIINMV